jgi:ABC-2 type transport system permease protein
MTDSLIQGTIVLLLGPLFGVDYTPIVLLKAYVVVFVMAAGLVSLGLVIGSQMESPEGFGMVVSFVVYPMFFLSGALFPIDNLPHWLGYFVLLDPLTYGVDALRGAMLGTSRFPYLFDLGVITAFAIFMIALGTLAFGRMKT